MFSSLSLCMAVIFQRNFRCYSCKSTCLRRIGRNSFGQFDLLMIWLWEKQNSTASFITFQLSCDSFPHFHFDHRFDANAEKFVCAPSNWNEYSWNTQSGILCIYGHFCQIGILSKITSDIHTLKTMNMSELAASVWVELRKVVSILRLTFVGNVERRPKKQKRPTIKLFSFEKTLRQV